MELSYENLSKYSINLDRDLIDRYFTDENGVTPNQAHRDQIFVLNGEASKYLWDFEHRIVGVEINTKFYKNILTYNVVGATDSEIKRYLYKLGIQFKQWVFIAEQPTCGFMLTWKMVIKYWSGLFFDDYQQVWDKSLNWKLVYNHGVFTFGEDLIFNSTAESQKILTALAEMKKRNY